jgi:hypothetical protein
VTKGGAHGPVKPAAGQFARSEFAFRLSVFHPYSVFVFLQRTRKPRQGFPAEAQWPTKHGWMSKSIFLSYARGDDEAFVARLHADLTARGFDVRWDGKMTKSECRMPKEGRKPKLERRAPPARNLRFRWSFGIRHLPFASATTSDYVIAEWQHAVTYGKSINPILRLGDYPLVPDELKLLHVEDFRDDTRYAFRIENLVRQLSEPGAPPAKTKPLHHFGLETDALRENDCVRI